MTVTPARFWKLPAPAAVAGPDASYVILARDPQIDPAAYVSPVAVYARGRRLK